MSTFNLDPAAVAGVEDLLRQTGDAVEREARQAADEITTLGGAGWSGAAFNAAATQQAGPFADEARRLYDVIYRLSDNLGLARQNVQFEDENNEQAFQATGNFDRLTA